MRILPLFFKIKTQLNMELLLIPFLLTGFYLFGYFIINLGPTMVNEYVKETKRCWNNSIDLSVKCEDELKRYKK